jgi:hypothetical protein
MAQSVHNLLHTGISDKLKWEIEDGVSKKVMSHTALKEESLTFFEMQSYKKQVRVTYGQSCRIATKKALTSHVEQNVVYKAENPTFNLKKATQKQL